MFVASTFGWKTEAASRSVTRLRDFQAADAKEGTLEAGQAPLGVVVALADPPASLLVDVGGEAIAVGLLHRVELAGRRIVQAAFRLWTRRDHQRRELAGGVHRRRDPRRSDAQARVLQRRGLDQ